MVNKSRVMPEVRRDTLPDNSIQPIIAELHAIREAICQGDTHAYQRCLPRTWNETMKEECGVGRQPC